MITTQIESSQRFYLKTSTLKKFLILVCLQIVIAVVFSQVPAAKGQSDEMVQMIADLKSEIQTLEKEIKVAEKEDPDGVPMLKKQLASLQALVAGFDKSKKVPSKGSRVSPKSLELAQTPSPTVPVYFKQSIPSFTAAQARDRFFWYRGKKINDSTLVTLNRTLVQYSKKRDLLIVQPEEKKDSFFLQAKEIQKTEERKLELASSFDQMTNGFLYFPYVARSMAVYDDLTRRFSAALRNTISFEPLNSTTRVDSASARFGRGGGSGAVSLQLLALISRIATTDAEIDPGVDWVIQQLDDAYRKCLLLPPAETFSTPPPHELGQCATCDGSLLRKQFQLDSIWINDYQGKETAIFRQALSAMRTYTFLSGDKADDRVQQKFDAVFDFMIERMEQKDQVLLNRYGSDLRYFTVVGQTILAHQRQRQMIGDERADNKMISELNRRIMPAFWKYFDEQATFRNHDFILNVPLHLGIFRQLTMLGDENQFGDNFSKMMDRVKAYNRFALSMKLDFVWQKGSDAEFDMRATGTMETPDKVFFSFYPDSCSFRIMGYKTNAKQKSLQDISVPLQVQGGVKTIRRDNDNLVNYSYSGPQEYLVRFPDARIEFCTPTADTLFLAIMGGSEAVAARGQAEMQRMNSAYTLDMLIFASQVLINEDAEDRTNEMMENGVEILNKIAGFSSKENPQTVYKKLELEHAGYMDMDDARKNFESSFSTQKAKLLFNANNGASVVADTYVDLKRTMQDDIEIKRGLFHIRIEHEPESQ